MKKTFAVLGLLVIIVFAAVGCEAHLPMPTQNGAEAKDNKYFYDDTSGRIITDLSDRFDFKINQWMLSPDDDSGAERLLFGVTVKNKTKTSLKNFNCDIQFDKQLIDFFTTGLTYYDQYEAVDLIPDVTANGVGYSVDLSLNTEEQMLEYGADKDKLFEIAQRVTLKMSWDGGEETVTLDCGKPEKAQVSLLAAKDFVNIELSTPEGSGAIRTLTLHYLKNGEEKTDALDDISYIDNSGYDDEAREQTLSDSDNDGDGIVDFIVFREFWFPDLKLVHPEVPRWPTVYEYDLNCGFVAASAKHKAYFVQYAKTLTDQLDETESEQGKLAVRRLIYAAQCIADGRFVPADLYMDTNYYQDIYELTKGIKE